VSAAAANTKVRAWQWLGRVQANVQCWKPALLLGCHLPGLKASAAVVVGPMLQLLLVPIRSPGSSQPEGSEP
jgi:hypothetical protein